MADGARNVSANVQVWFGCLGTEKHAEVLEAREPEAAYTHAEVIAGTGFLRPTSQLLEFGVPGVLLRRVERKVHDLTKGARSCGILVLQHLFAEIRW
ncbi:MAG: hypothetical protein AB1762_03945 [Gemmatimonadota bacterium]